MNRHLFKVFACCVCALALTTGLMARTSAPMAPALETALPVTWSQAYRTVISPVDEDALDKGEVLHALLPVDETIAIGQTMGVVNAPLDTCFALVQDYDRYKDIMPFTAESKTLRSFTMDGGAAAGTPGKDFWTRISVFGIDTRYVLRVAHQALPDKAESRSWWTLVDKPELVCKDASGKPCQNDLATNLGSHRFTAFRGDPNRTLHTYTLRVEGTSWAQKKALSFFGGSSMTEVTKSIRKAAEAGSK